MGKTVVIVLVIMLLVGAGYLVFANSKKGGMPYNGTSSGGQNTNGTLNSDSQQPPSQIALSIASPADKSTVTSSSVTVSGKTAPNADVFVNDTDTKADSSGNFSSTVNLEEGDNVINVGANDDSGNYSEKELTVTYDTGNSE